MCSEVKFYMAPMEGITRFEYRNIWHRYFGDADKYFTPFISPITHGKRKSRELRDIDPENNPNIPVVPQLLTNKAEDFIQTARELKEMGYQEVNLNLGCPSGTVVAKKKGSGFLEFPKELDEFLYEIFAQTDMDISIKTRIGRYEKEEWEPLLSIYNKYPISELIIHPRLRTDFYKNSPDQEAYALAAEKSRNKLCYNGDIFIKRQYEQFSARFPNTETVMLGRGLVRNPFLIRQLKGQENCMNKTLLQEFHQELYAACRREQSGDTNVLHHMKEIWFYMVTLFTDYEPYGKKIRKAQKLSEYESSVNNLFREQELLNY